MLLIQDLFKSFRINNGQFPVIDNLNLQVNKGEFVSILGPNGCGKTTLLNIIAGIEPYTYGSIKINNKPIKNSKIGYIFQNFNETLFPWLNSVENISLPLKFVGLNKKECLLKVKSLCEKYNIQIPLNRYPYALSGGEQQLVAIARAIIVNPDLILMDEPFSSLDLYTTLTIQKKIFEIRNKSCFTTIFVSHRLEDALYLSNRIIIFSNRPIKIILDMKNPLKYPRKEKLLISKNFRRLKKDLQKFLFENYNQ